ncbi:MAG: hypothetical protein U9N35_08810 [Euryarchaeota archaeon]|nr:hypothetical protein [Euryarchaeota archaeon]
MLVEVENLTKSFRNIEALKGINFTMDEGVYGLIGPNGAGNRSLQ